MSYLQLYSSGQVETPKSIQPLPSSPQCMPSQVNHFNCFDIFMALIFVRKSLWLQVRYRHQDIRNDVAQEILKSLDNVLAIDLSHNILDTFPKFLSQNLTALDLSHNYIERPIASQLVCNLVELNMAGNSITE